MTVLCLLGQDIGDFRIGLIKDGVFVSEVRLEIPPEKYLMSLDRTLKEWGVVMSDVGAVAVVSGPGSFTCTRLAVMIANTVSFARQIPVLSWENPDRLSLQDLAARQDWNILPVVGHWAHPAYDRPPHITTPAKRWG